MNRNRRSFSRLSVLAGAFAGLVCAGSATITRAQGDGNSNVTLSSAQVNVKGTVNGRREAVAFAGPVQIRARAVPDPDFGAPTNLELSIDLSGVKGVGLSTGNKYVTQGREVISLPLLSGRDEIAIDFPYRASSTKGASSAYEVGQVTFQLLFSVPFGALTEAQGQIDTPAVVEEVGSGR